MLAIKGARAGDSWNVKDMLEMNDKVIFFLGGKDLTDHEKRDKNQTMSLLKAGTGQGCTGAPDFGSGN